MGVRFGETARSARLDREITLKTVGDALGFTAAYLSDIERGQRNPPSPDKARRWASIIGLDPEPFVHLAAVDRSVVELPVSGSQSKGELAYMLARAWSNLTPEQEEKLKETLEPSLGDES